MNEAIVLRASAAVKSLQTVKRATMERSPPSGSFALWRQKHIHAGSAFPVPKLSSAASCFVQRELYASVSFCSTNANRKNQRQLENLSQHLDSIFLPHNLPHKFPHNMREIRCIQKIKALYLAIILLDTTIYSAIGWGSWIRTNE